MKIFLSVLLAIALIASGVSWINLNSTKTDLRETATQLETAQSQLTSAEAELTGVKTELADTQAQLTSTKTELQTTTTQLSTTESQLQETESQLTDTTTQLESAYDQNTRMVTDYSALREQINLKLGNGEDGENFITPNEPLVSSITRQIAGTYSQDINEVWRDYQRLYQWVVDNIIYNYDTNLPLLPSTLDGRLSWTQEYWKMPEETLNDKNGDCEDMAGLLTSMILSYNNHQYSIWVVIIHNNDSGHVGVVMPVEGDKLCILDPAGNYFTGYYDNWLQSEDVSLAVSNWLSHWSTKMPGAYITAALSDDFYKEFSGTQEFIDWARNQ